MTEKDRYELKIAGLLHDCGKVTTPVHVVDKATKLETIFDRIHLVDTRFEVLKRDAEIELLHKKLELARAAGIDEITRRDRAYAIDEDLRDTVRQIDEDREFLRRCNIGGESMPKEEQDRVAADRSATSGATRSGNTRATSSPTTSSRTSPSRAAR